jgi:hypothetical protein
MLTQAELKELLHYDPATGVFTWLVSPVNSIKVGSIAGTLNHTGYRHIQIKGETYQAHRLAWLYIHSVWPKDQIDHRNHVHDANWIDNLREATAMQNRCNTSNNTSGVPGVCWYKRDKKWLAQIMVAGKNKNLGLFVNIEDAAEARRVAELKYFGVNAL